jgi:hypothetical protein
MENPFLPQSQSLTDREKFIVDIEMKNCYSVNIIVLNVKLCVFYIQIKKCVHFL